MDIYHYKQSDEFSYKGTASRNPVRPDKFLIPANATLLAPPYTAAGQVAVFRDGSWSVAQDHRGMEYWLDDGSKHLITELDEVPPTDALNAPPEPSFDETKAAQIAQLNITIDVLVDDVAGQPSRREVTSWPVKIAAANRVLSGELPSAQSLVPVQLKHSMTPIEAAQLVLLNARIYELVNTAAETLRETHLPLMQAALDDEALAHALASFEASKTARLAQLDAIQTAAKSGDLAPLEAAEAEIAATVADTDPT